MKFPGRSRSLGVSVELAKTRMHDRWPEFLNPQPEDDAFGRDIQRGADPTDNPREGDCTQRTAGGSVAWGYGTSFHREADLDGHLPVGDVVLLDVAAGVDDLEPAQVLHRLAPRLMALLIASSMDLVEVPVSSMSL